MSDTPITPLTFTEAGTALEAALKAQAAQFIADNQQAVIQLGQDLVTSLLQQAIVAQLDAIPGLLENAPAVYLATREAVLQKRSETFQLVAAAEAQNAATVASVKSSALSVAKSIVSTVIGVAGSVLMKTVGGGLLNL